MLLHKITGWMCNHCGTISTQTVLHAQSEKKLIDVYGAKQWTDADRIRVFVSCDNCGQPYMLALRPKEMVKGNSMSPNLYYHIQYLNRLKPIEALFNGPGNPKRNVWAVPAESPGEKINHLYNIDEQFPQSAIQRPNNEDLPEDLNKELDELIGVLGHPRYAMIGCRRVIEQACRKVIGQSAANGKKLYELIDTVLGEMETSRQISDWAHTLRHLGNDAVHSDDSNPTVDEARQAYELTRLLLDLVFSYPKRIARLRSK